MRGVDEQVHRLALTDAGLRRVAVGVHAEELLVGSFGDIAGETADDYVVESTGVPHRSEAALEGGGGHSTSWSNTGWDAGSRSSSATLRCHVTSPWLASYSRQQLWTGTCLFRGRAVCALRT